jgi:hypothetical protein
MLYFVAKIPFTKAMRARGPRQVGHSYRGKFVRIWQRSTASNITSEPRYVAFLYAYILDALEGTTIIVVE